MAETNGLLNRRTGKSGTEGSNPSVSANSSQIDGNPLKTGHGASSNSKTATQSGGEDVKTLGLVQRETVGSSVAGYRNGTVR